MKPALESLSDVVLPDAEPQLLSSGSYVRLEHVLYVGLVCCLLQMLLVQN